MNAIYLLLAVIIILAILWGCIFISTIIDIYTLGNRVEDSLIAAGWAGFAEIDLDKLAKRRDIKNEENRDIYVEKDKAILEVQEYIRKNLKLDAGMVATADSYIVNKSYPVLIDEITVFNPDELPATCSRGVKLNRTTIHIVIRVPADIKFLGFKYLEKHIDVDTKSFYKN